MKEEEIKEKAQGLIDNEGKRFLVVHLKIDANSYLSVEEENVGDILFAEVTGPIRAAREILIEYKKLKKERSIQMREEQKNEHRMGFARREAAKAWRGEKTSGKTMDPELTEELAKILSVHMYKPHLGCATTRELLAEITARVSGGPLDYRTNKYGLKAVD